MEKNQQLEWVEAQKIAISENLVDVAKKQLKFLGIVDLHRCLYDGPVLDHAIFRYKTYWLPLLARHTECDDVNNCHLVVPLDCEWIWHCHRLNPLRYKSDCNEFFGRILDNKKVISSTMKGCPKQQTEEIWIKLYPEEPYELDLTGSFKKNILVMSSGTSSHNKTTQYDLVDAVKRQSTFFYQVSRPSMNDDLFLEGAVARYKGFLHMVKKNLERSSTHFCVPTNDIDLIWHSHQLNPVSYYKDTVEIMGKVLGHDDTDSNRKKGSKLHSGFLKTTEQWEDTFGSRYWRAGAMYNNIIPSPITNIPWQPESKSSIQQLVYPEIVRLSRNMVVEVLLEIVDVQNLPENYNENLFVLFSKKKPDAFFCAKKWLSILSKSREKEVASFKCEPSEELFLELMSHVPSSLPISRPAKAMGTISIPLNYIMDSKSKLSVDEWFELESCFGTLDSNPIRLRVGVSVSVPEPEPHVLEMVQPCPLLRNGDFFPSPGSTQHSNSWRRVIDEAGNEIFNVQMREAKYSASNDNLISKEIFGVVGSSGEIHVLAKFIGMTWYLVDPNWSFQIKKTCSEDGHIFELSGSEQVVKLYPGRKLEYEAMCCEGHNSKCFFITAVDFSTENPYGKAVALLDLNSGVVKINEDWFMLAGITLNVLLSDILRKEGYDTLIANGNYRKTCNLMENGEYDVNLSEHTALGNDWEVHKKVSSLVPKIVVDKKQRENVKNDAFADDGVDCFTRGSMIECDLGGRSGFVGKGGNNGQDGNAMYSKCAACFVDGVFSCGTMM